VASADGRSAHWAAQVFEAPQGEDWCWLDVNFYGSRLPQMYRHSEVLALRRRSELAPHGLCVPCLGFGQVLRVFGPAPETCEACNGRGRPDRVMFPPDACPQCKGGFTWK
jgi:hypothetical protein